MFWGLFVCVFLLQAKKSLVCICGQFHRRRSFRKRLKGVSLSGVNLWMGFLCLVYSCTNFYLSWHTLVILFSPADQSVSGYCTRTVLFCTTLDFKLGEHEGSNQEGESHFILTQFDLIFLHPVHLTSIFCITICLLLQFVLFFEVREAQRCNIKKLSKSEKKWFLFKVQIRKTLNFYLWLQDCSISFCTAEKP